MALNFGNYLGKAASLWGKGEVGFLGGIFVPTFTLGLGKSIL